MDRFENLSLTFQKNLILKTSPPLVGGDSGEGDPIGFVHPHLNPPPSKGEDIIGEI
jgi:hypothetical protein